eukprot:SAG31_NODE_14254_length_818_cov_1.257302_1_plen_149_part_00
MIRYVASAPLQDDHAILTHLPHIYSVPTRHPYEDIIFQRILILHLLCPRMKKTWRFIPNTHASVNSDAVSKIPSSVLTQFDDDDHIMNVTSSLWELLSETESYSIIEWLVDSGAPASVAQAAVNRWLRQEDMELVDVAKVPTHLDTEH